MSGQYLYPFLHFYRVFSFQKQCQKSRSVFKDRSRSLGLFRKSKISIIAKFERTDLVTCSHSRESKILSYS